MTIYTPLKTHIPSSVLTEKLGEDISAYIISGGALMANVGYVGDLGLDFLISCGRPKKASSLCVGMSQDGFTPSQNEKLSQLQHMGWTILTTIQEHHKIYHFIDNQFIVIGSHNLNSIVPHSQNSNGLMEISMGFYEKDHPEDYFSISNIIKECRIQSVNFDPTNVLVKERSPPPSAVFDILDTPISSPLGPNDYDISAGGFQEFKIPLKMEPFSNFNIGFAKPKNKNSLSTQKRNWLEFELNIPSIFHSLGIMFPMNENVTLITDTGYQFAGRRNGDKGKSFQSTPNLQIFGSYVKGKLMDAGLLHVGQKGVDQMLVDFGSDHLVFTKLTGHYRYRVSFAPENGFMYLGGAPVIKGLIRKKSRKAKKKTITKSKSKRKLKS